MFDFLFPKLIWCLSRKLCYRATLGADNFDLNKEKLDGVAPVLEDPPDANSSNDTDVHTLQWNTWHHVNLINLVL